MLRTFSGGLLPSPASSTPAAGGPGGPALRFALAAPADVSEGDLPTPQAKLQQQPGGLQAASLVPAAPLGEWSSRLQPYEAAGRQRLYLQQPGSSTAGSGGLVMLTYRVLLSGGCFHLVLFR